MHIRLEAETDFFLVFPPVCRKYKLVLAYHAAFREKIGELSPLHWHDATLFPRYRLYYEKLALLLFPSGCDLDALTVHSRHSFFVTEGLGDDNRLQLSGLQRLLGFQPISESESPKTDTAQLTTGQPYLDIIASLVLLEIKNIPWLVDTYSLDELASLTHYLWQQKAASLGQTPDHIAKQDMETWSKLVSENGAELEAARREAQQFLLLRNGPAAMEVARLQEQEHETTEYHPND